MHNLTRILSIDGGGIRGIIPGEILISLEEKIRVLTKNPEAKISDYFDFIAGTSTGGIMACILLCPGENGSKKPRYSASDVVNFYYEYSGKIFNSSVSHRIKSLNGWIDEKYSACEMERILQIYFNSLELKDLVKPCLIPAYDIEKRTSYFFTKHTADKKKNSNFLLKDVARGTSAAPTFFEPATIRSLSGQTLHLIDGGVFAANPALCAYVEAGKLYNKLYASEMLILSLGTGELELPYKTGKARNWGKLQWIQPMIDILLLSSQDTTDYQLRKIFEASGCSNQYLRINPSFNKQNMELNEIDNASKDNLEVLRQFGKSYAGKHDEELQAMAEILVKDQVPALSVNY